MIQPQSFERRLALVAVEDGVHVFEDVRVDLEELALVLDGDEGSLGTEQARPMDDPHAVHPGAGAGQVERLGHVRRLHRRPERPRQDVARVVVEHGRQVVPAPPDHL